MSGAFRTESLAAKLPTCTEGRLEERSVPKAQQQREVIPNSVIQRGQALSQAGGQTGSGVHMVLALES